MNENNPHIKMFVADTLMDGIESFSGIIAMLNDRRIGGWRNAVTHDFTIDDVRSALEELIRLGYLDMWRDDIGGLVPVEGENDVAATLAYAKEDEGSLWFRLTTDGRQAVETWAFPEMWDRLLMKYVQSSPASPTSLHSAYNWLNQQIGQQLAFPEFASLIDYMSEYDYLCLWQSPNNSQDQESMVQVAAMPSNLDAGYVMSEPTGNRTDLPGYFLTLGDDSAKFLEPEPAPEPLAEIADPLELLKKLTERDRDKLAWFTGRKAIRHIVVSDKNAVTLGIGSVAEFQAKMRWGKGLPEAEDFKARHIVLDETGKVIGDYYGPASFDPLDAGSTSA